MPKAISRILSLILILTTTLACQASTHIPSNVSAATPDPQNTPLELPTPTLTFLPLVRNGTPKFLGIIMKHYWSKENVEQYMPEADALAGKQHTAVGWFIDIQDPAFYEDWETESALNRNNFYRQLEQLWQKGYISLVKIGSTDTARSIHEGKYDNSLTQMAKIYKRWIDQGGSRKAMLAPLQEMNGDWVSYYDYPSEPEDLKQKLEQRQRDFRLAYNHIQDVFTRNGIDRSMVWWVFAPNGLSSPDVPENNFEYYYPGDDRVDLVGFASYNYGFCPATLSPACANGDCGRWENYDTIYTPYITRMQKMGPTKPILITETGSSAMYTQEDRGNNTYNYAMKAEWLVLNYGYLARQPMVLGVFYFDVNDFDGKLCDLALPRENFDGYRKAVTGYQYLSASVLNEYIP